MLTDIRRVLSDLCARGMLLKIALEGINFWALNPHFFTPVESGKSPLGNSPRGNAPSVKKGDFPTGDPGEITQGGCGATDRNQKENFNAKNLSQESLKESHLTSEFPDDMLERWKSMSLRESNPKIDKEKKLFKSLLEIHKHPFFEKCGQVVAFLEKHGATKDGKTQAIHSPMVWIQNHWDSNLARYETWKVNQETKENRAAEKIERESKAIAEKTFRTQERVKTETERKNRLDGAAERFLTLYREVEEANKFILEALEILNNKFTRDFYTRHGWEHPAVREDVLEHFLMVESGERITKVNPELFSNKSKF